MPLLPIRIRRFETGCCTRLHASRLLVCRQDFSKQILVSGPITHRDFPSRKQEPFTGLGEKGDTVRSLSQQRMYGCESGEKGLFLSAQGFGGGHADLGDIYDAGAHAHNLLGITNLLDDDETTTHQPISRCASALLLCHLSDVAFRTEHVCRRAG